MIRTGVFFNGHVADHCFRRNKTQVNWQNGEEKPVVRPGKFGPEALLGVNETAICGQFLEII
jgi:hypothetical protein